MDKPSELAFLELEDSGRMTRLDLRNLMAISSMSPSMLAFYAEAASVMLWRFHMQGRGSDTEDCETQGTWKHQGPLERRVGLCWTVPSEPVLASHGNEKDATEEGAYAVAIAVAHALGFRVLGRVHQGSGCDLIMIPIGEPANDYYKLEVSGMARIGSEKPETRLADKVDQGQGGDLRRPGIALVTRFQDACILSEAWQ